MDKQLFDDAIGEVPPSSVDVDAVITRGRRADRIRRVANPAVAAGVAVVLAVGAIAYTMTRSDGGDGSGGIGVGSSPTSTGSSTPSSDESTSVIPSAGSGVSTTGGPGPNQPAPTPPEACSRPDLETATELNTRLAQVAGTAVQAQRSDMPLTANPGMEYPNGTPRGALEFFQVSKTPGTDQPICDVDSYSMARATTNGPEGAGNLLIAVSPEFYDGRNINCAVPSTEETFCDVVTTQNGDRVRKSSSSFEGGTSGHRVDLVRADGTSVVVTIEDIGTSIKSGDGPTASAIPLTLDQLVAVATAPGMTMFP